MASAPCNKCGATIEGSLAEIVRHIKKCGTTPKRREIKPGAPGAVIAGAIPRLPWTVAVPLSISSLNQSQYSHWSVYKKGKDTWSMALSMLLRPVAGLRLNWSEWEITRCWSHPHREMDFGNLVGGAKPIPDAMIEMGIIVDDKPANFHCIYVQQRVHVRSYTRLTLLRTADERPSDIIQ